MPREPILVLGFGPFQQVADNPAAQLARAVDGTTAGRHPIVGREMPVSYRRAPEQTRELVEALRPVLVLGIGVARDRVAPWVERTGRRLCAADQPDVDAWCAADLDPVGPLTVSATLDTEAFARALGCGRSDDAGAYVCNGWLYSTVRLLAGGPPVGFLHIPAAGLDPERLREALGALVGAAPAATR